MAHLLMKFLLSKYKQLSPKPNPKRHNALVGKVTGRSREVFPASYWIDLNGRLAQEYRSTLIHTYIHACIHTYIHVCVCTYIYIYATPPSDLPFLGRLRPF